MLMIGIAIGLYFPLPYYFLLLLALLIACTLTRKKGHIHDLLTLCFWLLLGCSRASVVPFHSVKPAWEQVLEAKAQSVQTALAVRLQRSGVSRETLALTEALVLGRKDDLSRETKRAYRDTGAAHLLALSGLHLGIIYGFLYLVFIRWIRHTKWRWHALPLILLTLWAYALVAAMPISLVRAALMLSILTITTLMEHRTDPLHPLALSAIIILLISPTDLLSISFQLSFAAVFFILTLWQPITDAFPSLPWVVKTLGVSCIASLGTMPLVAYHFHQLPLLGPLLSIVLIPLTTFIIYLTLMVMAFPFPLLGKALGFVVGLQQQIIELAAGIPFATLTSIRLSVGMVALIYGAMLLAIVRLRTR